MHELFLTALVEDSDFEAAIAFLCGFCDIRLPWEKVDRVLYFQGPPQPTGITNQSSIQKRFMRKDTALLWKELHQSLSRQSCILQARYEVDKDLDLEPTGSPMDLDNLEGVLRWADFPDPPHGRPLITQRKTVEIWEQENLPSILRDNNFRFKTEVLEESYYFFRGDVKFRLLRHLFTRGIEDYTPLEARGGQQPTPATMLPAWEAITPVDSQKRWFLLVERHVVQDNNPDEIRKAQDQLLAVRAELEGAFEFRAIDRKVHDTRIAQQQQGIQALPQKVMLGKT
ncbi:hypothetical protein C2857_007642 [Epichloe festucae Fl1]|uniref:Mediator of RNA polymerase II transcription subunit 18 n=1 Tax=Epichloe festucae (strain Fl1) TaxID=877507 RepID=A0A7S9KQX8_EPIFF|nr:hypothetical protein C2857_007642 [Epichloe festucae Fl1]